MIKEKVIICDIDGCILDTSWIHKQIAELGLTQEQAFKYFDMHIGSIESKTIIKIRDFLRLFDKKVKIVFVTARSENIRAITYEQLTKAMRMFPEIIYMRPYGNLDEPRVLKEKILLEIKERFEVILAIDDNPGTCLMYEDYGIPVICCNTEKLIKTEKGSNFYCEV